MSATPPGPEPAGDEIDPGAAWRGCAAELADWTLPYVLRFDCHGGHTAGGGRTTRHSPLTREVLVEHFAAEDGLSVRGIHVTSPDERGVLVVVDIDAHGDVGDDPEKNRAFARHVGDEARRLGLVALLLDSNGEGGFHVWIFLGQMTPMAEAWRLGKYLVRDHAAFGFAKPPETFPKGPRLTGKRYGHWVRIMGRHHKRPFWTKVWDWRRECWEEGEAAVSLILGTTPVPVDVSAVLPGDFTGEPARDEPAAGVPTRRSLVSQAYAYRRMVRLAEEAIGHLQGGEVDDYDPWLAVGMALTELGDDGLMIWDAWSRQSTKYRRGETREKWQSFQPGGSDDRRTVGLGTLVMRAAAQGFKGHLALRRWAEYEERGVLDEGEDAGRLADEARDHKFSLACDEAVAALESRPDLRAELAAAWDVSAATTRLVGAGLREDLDLRGEEYVPTGRWAITVPLSVGPDPARALTVGYVRLYPGEVWESRPGWGGRPGLVLPWDLQGRDGPIVVCGDPADTARALELGGCAVGLAEPTSPFDELVSFLGGDLAKGREVVVAPTSIPGGDRWAEETAYHLEQLTGRPIKFLALPGGARSLRDCLMDQDTSEARQEDGDGHE